MGSGVGTGYWVTTGHYQWTLDTTGGYWGLLVGTRHYWWVLGTTSGPLGTTAGPLGTTAGPLGTTTVVFTPWGSKIFVSLHFLQKKR